jgi:hypothetical protein
MTVNTALMARLSALPLIEAAMVVSAMRNHLPSQEPGALAALA